MEMQTVTPRCVERQHHSPRLSTDVCAGRVRGYFSVRIKVLALNCWDAGVTSACTRSKQGIALDHLASDAK
jgi:hypothetical protein